MIEHLRADFMDLSQIATPVLELLARRLADRPGHSPLDLADLRAFGLEDAAPALLAALGGLDPQTTLCAVLAVLRERDAPKPTPPELVWTGTSPGKDARDTRVLLQQLFTSAQTSVLIAGYAFDHGEDLFAPLHEAMRDRGVEVRFYINIEQEGQTVVPKDAVARQVAQFRARNWPFGEPFPEVYFDSRVLTGNEYASLHAKCVVIDANTALVTSSNFTDRGQRRNIEVGVLLHDPAFANALISNFRAGDFGLADHS